jgi:hypothetical protein
VPTVPKPVTPKNKTPPTANAAGSSKSIPAKQTASVSTHPIKTNISNSIISPVAFSEYNEPAASTSYGVPHSKVNPEVTTTPTTPSYAEAVVLNLANTGNDG